MESGKYYVIGYGNNLLESMTKEQILAAITQAVEGHVITDVDTGFVTKIKEQKGGDPLMFWVGSTAEYNSLETKAPNCFYILTDDTELEDIQSLVNELNTKVNEIAEKSISTINDHDLPDGWSWHVHVYASGFVEAWGAKSVTNIDVKSQEGNMYVMADGGVSISYPTEVTGENFTQKTFNLGWNGSYYGIPFCRTGIAGGDRMNIMRAITAEGISGTFSIYMTGFKS